MYDRVSLWVFDVKLHQSSVGMRTVWIIQISNESKVVSTNNVEIILILVDLVVECVSTTEMGNTVIDHKKCEILKMEDAWCIMEERITYTFINISVSFRELFWLKHCTLDILLLLSFSWYYFNNFDFHRFDHELTIKRRPKALAFCSVNCRIFYFLYLVVFTMFVL